MKLYHQLFVFTTLFLPWNSPPRGADCKSHPNTGSEDPKRF